MNAKEHEALAEKLNQQIMMAMVKVNTKKVDVSKKRSAAVTPTGHKPKKRKKSGTSRSSSPTSTPTSVSTQRGSGSTTTTPLSSPGSDERISTSTPGSTPNSNMLTPPGPASRTKRTTTGSRTILVESDVEDDEDGEDPTKKLQLDDSNRTSNLREELLGDGRESDVSAEEHSDSSVSGDGEKGGEGVGNVDGDGNGAGEKEGDDEFDIGGGPALKEGDGNGAGEEEEESDDSNSSGGSTREDPDYDSADESDPDYSPSKSTRRKRKRGNLEVIEHDDIDEKKNAQLALETLGPEAHQKQTEVVVAGTAPAALKRAVINKLCKYTVAQGEGVVSSSVPVRREHIRPMTEAEGQRPINKYFLEHLKVKCMSNPDTTPLTMQLIFTDYSKNPQYIAKKGLNT